MAQPLFEKFISCVNGLLDIAVSDSDYDTDLSSLGMDSIKFIKLIVLLENEYDIEFPDDALLFSEMNTINKIYGKLTDITEGGKDID